MEGARARRLACSVAGKARRQSHDITLRHSTSQAERQNGREGMSTSQQPRPAWFLLLLQPWWFAPCVHTTHPPRATFVSIEGLLVGTTHHILPLHVNTTNTFVIVRAVHKQAARLTAGWRRRAASPGPQSPPSDWQPAPVSFGPSVLFAVSGPEAPCQHAPPFKVLAPMHQHIWKCPTHQRRLETQPRW